LVISVPSPRFHFQEIASTGVPGLNKKRAKVHPAPRNRERKELPRGWLRPKGISRRLLMRDEFEDTTNSPVIQGRFSGRD
jgi:hypothetical protein